MNLDRVLQRLPDVSLRLDARNEVLIRFAGRELQSGAHALALLELFAQPLSISQALDVLRPRLQGTQDWLIALRTIQQLADAGVLTEPGSQPSDTAFDHASLHIEMLNDQGRTEAFIQAIQSVVQPGHKVVEIGTGSGVLATVAAKAGAAKVYAIEAGCIRQHAAAIFESNQVADRVELLAGWSTQLTIPEPVDVLVAEILGHDAAGEDMVNIFHDAMRRFLKPGGIVIPQAIEVWAELVEIPRETSSRHRFEPEVLAAWGQAYGVDFSALAAGQKSIAFSVKGPDTTCWSRCSEPFLVSQHQFFPVLTAASLPDPLTVSVRDSGKCNGLLFHFKAHLAPGITISTRAQDMGASCHWRNVARLFSRTVDVQAGQQVLLDCRMGYLAAEWGGA